jgi:hypothetical protein
VSSVVERLRAIVRGWFASPNPIFMREIRQDARLARTPWMVMGATMLLALLFASMGAQPNDVQDGMGMGIFQGFFSLGFFLAAIAGPALSANSIAAEREGRTWEALLLTGMTPQEITRGKFLAAATNLGVYVVALAPVAAMCFLFGGVHWLEVLIAFFYLFWITMLWVGFGLAMSSRMVQVRGAIVVTIVAALPIAGMAYGLFGFGLGALAHDLWPQVPRELPVWLPVAYVRGDLGLWYVLLLGLGPLAFFGLPLWGLYEGTLANLTEPTDDRSTGLKSWFVGTLLAAAVGSIAVIAASPGVDVSSAAMVSVALTVVAGFLGVLVLLPDPLGASRRVQKRWELTGAGRVRRWLGPGLIRTMALVLGGPLLLIVLQLIVVVIRGVFGSVRNIDDLLRFASYSVGFYVFCVGLTVYIRARSNNANTVRLLVILLLTAIAAVPPIVALIVGIALFQSPDGAWVLAAPSPAFLVAFIKAPNDAHMLAGWAMAVGWGAIGALLFRIGRQKINGIVLDFEERLKASDRMFREEDEALAAAAAEADRPVEATSDPTREAPAPAGG